MSSEGIRREVAWRMFAHEYNDSDMSFKEGDDERAPNYVVTPTGAKVNRLFVVGVVTEVDEVGDDYYRVRVSDPTATYMVYAGQYQPDAVSFFRDLTTPEFVSVVGKARTYQPDDGDDVYTSIRPEEVNTADEDVRDRWNLEAAQHTIGRAEAMLAYLKGDSRAYDSHRPRLHDAEDTVEHYTLTEDYLEDLRREAYQVVAELAGVDADLDDLAEVEAEPEAAAGEPAGEAASDTASPAQEVAGEGTSEPSSEPMSGESDGSAEAAEEPAPEAEPSTDTEPSAPVADEPSTAETAGEATESAEPDTSASPAGEGSAEEEPAEPSETAAADSSFEEEFEDVDSEEAEWEWDEGERERVEEEFGGEFDTAAEIDGSGGADTTEGAGEPAEPAGAVDGEEATSPDEAADEAAAAEAQAGEPEDDSGEVDDLTAAEAGEVEEDEETVSEEVEEEPPADEPSADSGDGDVDAESVVMEVIEEHGDDEGVARPEIRSLAADRGVDEESAEEALEQLLLEGMCYPSDGDRIKPL